MVSHPSEDNENLDPLVQRLGEMGEEMGFAIQVPPAEMTIESMREKGKSVMRRFHERVVSCMIPATKKILAAVLGPTYREILLQWLAETNEPLEERVDELILQINGREDLPKEEREGAIQFLGVMVDQVIE